MRAGAETAREEAKAMVASYGAEPSGAATPEEKRLLHISHVSPLISREALYACVVRPALLASAWAGSHDAGSKICAGLCLAPYLMPCARALSGAASLRHPI